MILFLKRSDIFFHHSALWASYNFPEINIALQHWIGTEVCQPLFLVLQRSAVTFDTYINTRYGRLMSSQRYILCL